jgi:hypothetical protein
MTLYYIKQDDTVWGCGDPECCGEWYEDITESFVKCEDNIPEEEMTADHLHGCNGGGPVLKWRKAKHKEIQAYEDGKSEGFQEGSDWGIEWQKKKADDEAMKLFRPVQDMTVRELTKLGYVVRLEGEAIGKPNSTHIYEAE